MQMFENNDAVVRIYVTPNNDHELPSSPTLRWNAHANSPNGLDLIPANASLETQCIGLTPPSFEIDNQVQGTVHRSAEVEDGRLESKRWSTIITGSGHIFQSAAEFRDAIYLMSIAHRFKYTFKENRGSEMSLVCKVESCPWKVTCRSIRGTTLVQVHTFNNVHKHSLGDFALIDPDIKAKHVGRLIDEIIKASPEYKPRQICKDFLRKHGIHLSYRQAWNLKENAKYRIFGHPKNYYKLLPWLCEQIRTQNPHSHVQLTHSNGRFNQLFIAHGLCIHGFHMGCRPIIAIDSGHMSGHYGGALFAATTFDANDGMFPLAIGVLSGENYDDGKWFLQELTHVVGNREVVIISDRHPTLLIAVPELFGKSNHAYCFRHMKENFCSFFSKLRCKGNLNKVNAKKLLDSIAYARLDNDYVVALSHLGKFNPELATWVESNEPKHWVMCKFKHKRWDKMSTSIAESVNSWLRLEGEHSICTFVTQHMCKVADMLSRHKEEANKWTSIVRPRIEKQWNDHILKSASLAVTQYSDGRFKVSRGKVIVSVNLIERQCTCKAWDMSGIPCPHACAAIRKNYQNPADYVDQCFKIEQQILIFSSSFIPIESHDMPTIGDDGVVSDINGNVIPSLKPPTVKRHPGRPRKKRRESQFQDQIGNHCSRCRQPGHNRTTSNNPPLEDED